MYTLYTRYVDLHTVQEAVTGKQSCKTSFPDYSKDCCFNFIYIYILFEREGPVSSSNKNVHGEWAVNNK